MIPTRDLKFIVCFIEDLFFVSKIEAAAIQLGYQLIWIGRVDEISAADPIRLQRQPGEHLYGPGAVLIDRVTTWHPALIIFDLNNAAIPWREWLPLIKSAPATRRYPTICFGSHVDTEAIRLATSSGADQVYARLEFSKHLTDIIKKHAYTLDLIALEAACAEKISSLAIQGLELFNQGAFFEAHEVLEEAWNEDVTPGRELYRAILQVAVAYLQIERKNYAGAMKMFLRVRQWIEPLPERCRGVDVAQLRLDAQNAHDALISLGRDRISEFDRDLFRPVVYHS